MAYPKSSPVTGGDTAFASQYNNLREDALYPIYQNFTYGETIAVNDALYLKAADGKVYKTDADFADERIYNFIGFAKEAGVLNDVKKVQISGKVEGFTGLTVGSYYYLSNTSGAISLTPGTYIEEVGIAISSSELLIISKKATKVMTGSLDDDSVLDYTPESIWKYIDVTISTGFRPKLIIFQGKVRIINVYDRWRKGIVYHYDGGFSMGILKSNYDTAPEDVVINTTLSAKYSIESAIEIVIDSFTSNSFRIRKAYFLRLGNSATDYYWTNMKWIAIG